jgi:hypothetical protein
VYMRENTKISSNKMMTIESLVRGSRSPGRSIVANNLPQRLLQKAKNVVYIFWNISCRIKGAGSPEIIQD